MSRRLDQYRFFLGCASIDHVNNKYRELVKYHHPDKPTGSHESFVALKNEYDFITESSLIKFPISNVLNLVGDIYQYPKTPQEAYKKETVTKLSPDEIEREKAINHFNNLRATDITFNYIDDIIKKSKDNNLSKLWIYGEIQKKWDLNLDHFKYVTFKLGDKVHVAKELFRKYQLINV
jgi:hypothetical protein